MSCTVIQVIKTQLLKTHLRMKQSVQLAFWWTCFSIRLICSCSRALRSCKSDPPCIRSLNMNVHVYNPDICVMIQFTCLALEYTLLQSHLLRWEFNTFSTWKSQSHEVLTLKVLNFWKFTTYCSLKLLWSGMGEVVLARTSPTLHPPSPPTVHQLSQLAL